MYANLSLVHEALKDAIEKKGLSPDEKRDVVRHMHEAHGVSIRQGCQAASLPRSTYRYERRERDDSDVITALSELVEQKPGIGFWQAFDRLRRAGHSWNHKRVYRIYTAMQLNIRRRAKKDRKSTRLNSSHVAISS